MLARMSTNGPLIQTIAQCSSSLTPVWTNALGILMTAMSWSLTALITHSGRADILFSDVVLLLISTNHLPGHDLGISLFLNKDMRFKNMLLLGFGQLIPMHGFIQVTPMKLLHFNGNSLICSLALFLQGCLHRYLCHDHANDICTSVQTLPHQLCQPLRHAQDVLATL